MNIATQVLRAREGGAVKRVHTIPWIGEYTVAQHTFGMLTLLDLLLPSSIRLKGRKPISKSKLTRYILWHDVHERWTGDVPAGLRYFEADVRKYFKLAEKEVNEKFKFPLPPLTDKEKAWVRALDQLEFLLACNDQRALGNQNVEPYLTSVDQWFVDTKDVPDPITKFIHDFYWHRTNQRLQQDISGSTLVTDGYASKFKDYKKRN